MIHEMDSTKVSFSTYSLLNCFIVRKKIRLRSLSVNCPIVSLQSMFLPSVYAVGNNFSRVCLSVCVSVCLFVCLFVCLSI